MSVKIGLEKRALVAHGPTWQGNASCLRKTQLVESLEVLFFGTSALGRSKITNAMQDDKGRLFSFQ